MSEISGHTPGPWEVFGTDGMVIAESPDYGIIASAHRNCGPGDEPEQMQANAALIASAPTMAAELDRLRKVNAQMREALKKATHELNAIRARDGAPQHIDWHRGQPLQTSSVCEDYFNELVEECFAALTAAEADNG